MILNGIGWTWCWWFTPVEQKNSQYITHPGAEWSPWIIMDLFGLGGLPYHLQGGKGFLEGVGWEINDGDGNNFFRGVWDVFHELLSLLKISRLLLLKTNLVGGCLLWYLIFRYFFFSSIISHPLELCNFCISEVDYWSRIRVIPRCFVLLLFYCPPARSEWPNYDVMMLQPWSGTATILGSIDSVTS